MASVHRAMLLVGCASLLLTATAQADPAWRLVWSDEFAQADGSSPDTAKWSFDVGGGGWGNNELQTYTIRTNNCRVEGSKLVIEAHKETYTGTDGIKRDYTSARLKTQGKWSWAYGRIEARLQVPRGNGLWPAFWMLGTNFTSTGWPGCGEIDILEHIGREPAKVYGTIHGPGYSGGNGIGKSYTLPGAVAVADDFHVFAIEWQTNQIRWFVDGQPYFTVTPASLPGGTQWVFDHPHFVLLNLAVGGNWPGSPDSSTVFPQRFVVDYVRVYVPAAGGGGNALINPGFEVGGLANWSRYGANTYLQSSDSAPVHAGSNSFKVYGQFNGGDNYSGIFQDIAAQPGQIDTADGWAMTPSGDALAGPNTAWIEVSFRNASSNVLALYRTALLNTNGPAGAWLNLPVTNQLSPADFSLIGAVTNLVAPAGTAFVRYQVVFRQRANAGGSVFFDDLNLNPLSGTSAPSLAASIVGNNLCLAFTTATGVEYRLLYKDDLADAQWQTYDTLMGNGGVSSVIVALSGSRRFFRVARK